jgi:hypothetical protein
VIAISVEFRLLGDIEARINDRIVDLGPARRRCVLVALLVDANRSVSVDQLIDRVWADRPPQRAREVLYSYVSRLRQASAASTDVGIIRQSGGYLLTVDRLAVDLHRFGHLIGRARAADTHTAALALLDQALELWRGNAFATLDTCTVRKPGFGYPAWEYSLISPLRTRLRRTLRVAKSVTGWRGYVEGWRALVAALVRAVLVVMPDVLLERGQQMPRVVDQDPVQALAACGAYPAFGVGVRAGRLRRSALEATR